MQLIPDELHRAYNHVNLNYLELANNLDVGDEEFDVIHQVEQKTNHHPTQ
jgi:hypothetical protein